MPTYNPTNPDRKANSTSDIHNEIDSLTSDGFDGITALDGFVQSVVGDLTDSDIAAIEDYLNSELQERDW